MPRQCCRHASTVAADGRSCVMQWQLWCCWCALAQPLLNVHMHMIGRGGWAGSRCYSLLCARTTASICSSATSSPLPLRLRAAAAPADVSSCNWWAAGLAAWYQPPTVEEHLWGGIEPGAVRAAFGNVALHAVCGQGFALPWARLLVGFQRHVVLGVQHVRSCYRWQGGPGCGRPINPLAVHVVYGWIAVAFRHRAAGRAGTICRWHRGALRCTLRC